MRLAKFAEVLKNCLKSQYEEYEHKYKLDNHASQELLLSESRYAFFGCNCRVVPVLDEYGQVSHISNVSPMY